MNNPKIYGFCPAGCKWETVHRNEFDASKSAVPIYEDTTDHTYHLTNKDINLLENNPYYDVTQHFKIYDGTEAPSVVSDWNVAIYADIYIDGILKKTLNLSAEERGRYAHEIDFTLNSVTLYSGEVPTGIDRFSIQINGSTHIPVYENIFTTTTSVGIDIYVKNLGYPYTTEDGTTTERVDGCEDTKVYSIGYSKGFFKEPYTKEEIDEMFSETIGDIESALTEIEALEDSYIGGETA